MKKNRHQIKLEMSLYSRAVKKRNEGFGKSMLKGLHAKDSRPRVGKGNPLTILGYAARGFLVIRLIETSPEEGDYWY